MTQVEAGGAVTEEVAAPPAVRGGLSRLRDPYFWADWMVGFAFVAVVVGFSALAPSSFPTAYNANNILVAAAIPTIVAVGQTFVVMTAGIDLSVASILALSAVSFGMGFSRGWPLWVCAVLAVVAGLLMGLLNGIVIAWFKINDFIVTLGMLSVAAGVALVLADGKPVQVINKTLAQLAIRQVSVVPYLMIIALVVVAIAHVVLTQTRYGTHVLATGGDPEVARAMGVRVAAIKVSVYAISGTLCGLAAILTIARIGSAEPAANTSLLLNSVAAVVLGGVSLFGGRGTVIGPFVGALLLQAVINGLTVSGVPQYYQYIAVGAVVVVSAVLVRTAR